MGKRFSRAQIVSFLREREAGVPLRRLCLKHGFSDTAYYRWRAKYADGLLALQTGSLEGEIERLKHLLANVLRNIELLRAERSRASGPQG